MPARSEHARRPAPEGRGKLRIEPLTEARWDDFERLFGKSGAYGGCWCMWWRVTRREFEHNGNAGNREAMRGLVGAGEVPGLLAYAGDLPVGWCSLAPRQAFGSLNRSRVLKAIDDRPVWSIVCFYVARSHRGTGVIDELIEGAADWARQHGAGLLEAYPTDPRGGRLDTMSAFMGLPDLLARHGFAEVARPSEAKVVMRRSL